jgi:ABC-type molybdenum transport system ATPase subunit/photorepair protein PhrA
MKLHGPRPPIVRITNGTFYRRYPSSRGSQTTVEANPNPALFRNLNFELPAFSEPPQHWCVVGPSLSGKTTFLQILRGQHLSIPALARSHPYLSSAELRHGRGSPHQAIQYVGFERENNSFPPADGTASAYLSSRYESRREITDFSLRDYLLGNTQLNPPESSSIENLQDGTMAKAFFERIVEDLQLLQLLDLPVAFLSNGQGRRARIARALLKRPEVLLLDEPFMGLDPPTVASLSPLLQALAERSSPRLVMSARPQDPLPSWITHLVYLRDNCQIELMGDRSTVLGEHIKLASPKVDSSIPENTPVSDRHSSCSAANSTVMNSDHDRLIAHLHPSEQSENSMKTLSQIGDHDEQILDNILVEMDGCQIKYGGKIALGNWKQSTPAGEKDGLVWKVFRGQRWGVFGPNGSGKTTLVSLICSDHPQTYSLPIKLFGRSRLSEFGSGERPLTIWDIQSRIGHSSPEVHQHMPRGLTIRQVIENAWANTFKGLPKLDDKASARVDAALGFFATELDPRPRYEIQEGLEWANKHYFGEISFSAQRVALLLRAIIKSPDIVILDEAFSGMDDEVRSKCMRFLEHGDKLQYQTKVYGHAKTTPVSIAGLNGLSSSQALICISHIKEEVPDCVRNWICLPEPNSGVPARFGYLEGPLRTNDKHWRMIWDV